MNQLKAESRVEARPLGLSNSVVGQDTNDEGTSEDLDLFVIF